MGQLCDTIWGKKDGRPTSDFEQPVHTVCFTHNFLMDTVEISQGEFDTVMKKTYTGYAVREKNWQEYKNLDTIEEVDQYATWAQNSWNVGSGNPGFGTRPVDSAETGRGDMRYNFFQLMGMYGNVSEWCNDFAGPYVFIGFRTVRIFDGSL